MTEQTAQQKAEELAKAKIAAKEKRIADAAKKKEEAEKLKLVKQAEREKAIAERKAANEKAAADALAAKEAKPKRERTYDGPLLGLAERAKTQYIKGINGQLHSNDPVAQALESVPADKIVELLLKVLGETTNKYAHLNYGQQSMNLRNRLRGAIKRAQEVNGAAITLETVLKAREEYLPKGKGPEDEPEDEDGEGDDAKQEEAAEI
jgi:hypothetical protein